jgi:hypothetical protein
MSAKVLSVTNGVDDAVTYDIDAAGARLAIEFYRGDPDAGEPEWRVDITFVSEEVIIGGEGKNKHAAFMAAASREDVVVRHEPLPAIVWSDVDRALRELAAF